MIRSDSMKTVFVQNTHTFDFQWKINNKNIRTKTNKMFDTSRFNSHFIKERTLNFVLQLRLHVWDVLSLFEMTIWIKIDSSFYDSQLVSNSQYLNWNHDFYLRSNHFQFSNQLALSNWQRQHHILASDAFVHSKKYRT